MRECLFKPPRREIGQPYGCTTMENDTFREQAAAGTKDQFLASSARKAVTRGAVADARRAKVHT